MEARISGPFEPLESPKSTHWIPLRQPLEDPFGCGSKLRRGTPQVLVHVSTYQGSPFWNSGFLNHGHLVLCPCLGGRSSASFSWRDGETPEAIRTNFQIGAWSVSPYMRHGNSLIFLVLFAHFWRIAQGAETKDGVWRVQRRARSFPCSIRPLWFPKHSWSQLPSGALFSFFFFWEGFPLNSTNQNKKCPFFPPVATGHVSGG